MDKGSFVMPGRRELPPKRSTPLPSPKQHPPADSKKRRKFFENSDEFGGEMSIERHLYSLDRYRSTTGHIKFPRPLRATNVSEAFRENLNRNKAKLYEDLRMALKTQNVRKVTNIQFRNFSKPGYPQDGDQEVLTLLIEVDSDGSEGTHTWSAAKKDCSNLLQSYGIDNAEVEIIDPGKAFLPSLFSIPPNDPHIECYESFRDELVEFVCQKLKSSWVSVCLWQVGNRYAESSFEIVVMVQPFSVHDWQALSQDMGKSFIRKAEKGSNDMGVLFIPGGCMELGSERPGVSLADNLPHHPHLGSSIGVEGERGGGSFGGYMSLYKFPKPDPRFQRCVLTSAHAVRPSQSAPADVRKGYDINGVTVNAHSQDARRAMVRYPAVKDLESTRTELQDRVDRLYGTNGEDGEIGMQQLKRDLAQQEGRMSRAQAFEINSNKALNDLDRSRTLLKRCGTMPTNIGPILFSSGRGLNHSQRILDFALVKIHDQAMTDYSTQHGNVHTVNELGVSSAIEAFKHLRVGPDRMKLFRQKVIKNVVTGIGQIEKGKWYFKSGRTTGFTAGICNGTEAHVNMAGYRTRYGPDGKPGDFSHTKFTKELVIATPTEHQVRRGKLGSDDAGSPEPDEWVFSVQEDFANLGDSGALVVNIDNEACGLVFGSIVGGVGHYDWEEPDPPTWKAAKDVSLGTEEDELGTEPYGKIDNPWVYGASCGLVMSMDDIQEHLRLRAGMELDI